MYCWICKTNMLLKYSDEKSSEASAHWECISCGRTSKKGIGRCTNPACGSIAVAEEFSEAGSEAPVLLPFDESSLTPRETHCTECIQCEYCMKPLKSREYVCTRQDVGHCRSLDEKQSGTFWHWRYAHTQCEEARKKQ